MNIVYCVRTKSFRFETHFHVIVRLILLWCLSVVVLIDCCKSKATLADLEDDEDDAMNESSTERIVTPFVPLPIISRACLGFIMVTTDGSFGAIAVRVLPHVLVTSKLISNQSMEDLRVYYMDENNAVMYRRILDFYEKSDIEYVVIRCQSPPDQTQSPRVIGQVNTVPIATRMDPYNTKECFVYGVQGTNLLAVQIPVVLDAENENCTNANRLCAVAKKAGTCFSPAGSPLICEERLAGTRLDDKYCVRTNDSLVFSNLRYSDFWAMSKIHPTGYHDYSLVEVETRGRGPALQDHCLFSVFIWLLTLTALTFDRS